MFMSSTSVRAACNLAIPKATTCQQPLTHTCASLDSHPANLNKKQAAPRTSGVSRARDLPPLPTPSFLGGEGFVAATAAGAGATAAARAVVAAAAAVGSAATAAPSLPSSPCSLQTSSPSPDGLTVSPLGPPLSVVGCSLARLGVLQLTSAPSPSSPTTTPPPFVSSEFRLLASEASKAASRLRAIPGARGAYLAT